MEELPNGWTWEAAITRAMQLAGITNTVHQYHRNREMTWAKSVTAFAHYIAQHEKPPVDPDLMLLADILRALNYSHTADLILDGGNRVYASAALKLLKERK